MFRSNRVELVAIPVMVVLLGVLFLVFAVASIGVWAWIVAGVVIVTVILLLAWRAAQRHAHPPAADAPHPTEQRPAGPHRILVVVDASCSAHAVRGGVAARAAARQCDVFVVAPAAGTRLDRLTGDEVGYEKASRHLDEVLAALDDVEPIDVKGGKIGSHDPIQAVDESLREFPADEIVVAVAGGLELAEGRYGIAVTTLDTSSAERV